MAKMTGGVLIHPRSLTLSNHCSTDSREPSSAAPRGGIPARSGRASLRFGSPRAVRQEDRVEVRNLGASPRGCRAARVRLKTARHFGEPALLACALARAGERHGHAPKPDTARVLRQPHMRRELGSGQNRASNSDGNANDSCYVYRRGTDREDSTFAREAWSRMGLSLDPPFVNAVLPERIYPPMPWCGARFTITACCGRGPGRQ
jgi:hypothetical protein